jgi:hypothetical protein
MTSNLDRPVELCYESNLDRPVELCNESKI